MTLFKLQRNFVKFTKGSIFLQKSANFFRIYYIFRDFDESDATKNAFKIEKAQRNVAEICRTSAKKNGRKTAPFIFCRWAEEQAGACRQAKQELLHVPRLAAQLAFLTIS